MRVATLRSSCSHWSCRVVRVNVCGAGTGAGTGAGMGIGVGESKHGLRILVLW